MSNYTFEQLTAEIQDRSATLMQDVSPDVREVVAKTCAADLLFELNPDLDAQRRFDKDLFNNTHVYAVPDESLDLFPSLLEAAISFFTTGPAAALPGLFRLMFRYRRLKVRITVDEALILRALKHADVDGKGALTSAEIRDRLIDQREFSISDINKLLAELLEKCTRDVSLLEQVGNKWCIGNV